MLLMVLKRSYLNQQYPSPKIENPAKDYRLIRFIINSVIFT